MFPEQLSLQTVKLQTATHDVAVQYAGGGIYGTLTVSTAPQIYQNLLLPTQDGKDESLNNIYLPTGKTIEIGESGLCYDEATYTPPLLSVTTQDASAAITGNVPIIPKSSYPMIRTAL